MTQEEFSAYIQKEIRPAITPVQEMFGPTINFFHRVVFVIGISAVVYIIVSLLDTPDPEKSQLTWTALGGHNPARLKQLGLLFAGCLVVYVLLAVLTHYEFLTPVIAALLSFLVTVAVYFNEANKKYLQEETQTMTRLQYFISSDLVHAGVLAGLAMFMMFYFF